MDIQPIGSTIAQSLRNAGQASATIASAPAFAVAAGHVDPEQSAVPDLAPSQLTQAVATINQSMQKLAPGLEFSIDQESNRTIVKIVDKQTNELIRQMPSAEMLEIAKALDRVQGLLISLRA